MNLQAMPRQAAWEPDAAQDVAAFGAYRLPRGLEGLRRLGVWLGTGTMARYGCSLIRRLLCLLHTGPFDIVPFPGQRVRLYPGDNLAEKRVLASVQFWDRRERELLGKFLRRMPSPSYFVDAGANVGLYTLAARAAVANRLRGLAIEPDQENLRRLRFNLRASDAARDIVVAPVALADRTGTMPLARHGDNRGEIALGQSDGNATLVPVKPLADLVAQAGFTRIDVLKIDIEGMEHAVLEHFFKHTRPSLWPGMVIIEARRGAWTPALSLLDARGYTIEMRTRMNAVLKKQTDPSETTGDTGNVNGNQA